VNDTFHNLGVAVATTMIGVGLGLMTVPWLGAHALFLAPGALGAVAGCVAVGRHGRRTQ
jgi:hypothetical protein